MNSAARALGRMGKGVPKTLTAKERRRRARSLAEVRKRRWIRRQNAHDDLPAVAGKVRRVVRHSSESES